jgi:CO/xanthine dehydrogenase Mo-binding subunit
MLFERSTGASRTTTLMGRAVMEACREAIAQCKSMAAEVLSVPASELIEERGGIRHGKEFLTWPEIMERYFQMEGCSIIGRAYLRRAGPFKSVPIFWEIGVVGTEIALDEETGKISLDTLVTVGDVGLAIHPAMTESQDLGAATMGLGIGLFEELIYDGQQLPGRAPSGCLRGGSREYRHASTRGRRCRWGSLLVTLLRRRGATGNIIARLKTGRAGRKMIAVVEEGLLLGRL